MLYNTFGVFKHDTHSILTSVYTLTLWVFGTGVFWVDVAQKSGSRHAVLEWHQPDDMYANLVVLWLVLVGGMANGGKVHFDVAFKLPLSLAYTTAYTVGYTIFNGTAGEFYHIAQTGTYVLIPSTGKYLHVKRMKMNGNESEIFVSKHNEHTKIFMWNAHTQTSQQHQLYFSHISTERTYTPIQPPIVYIARYCFIFFFYFFIRPRIAMYLEKQLFFPLRSSPPTYIYIQIYVQI